MLILKLENEPLSTTSVLRNFHLRRTHTDIRLYRVVESYMNNTLLAGAIATVVQLNSQMKI